MRCIFYIWLLVNIIKMYFDILKILKCNIEEDICMYVCMRVLYVYEMMDVCIMYV